MDSIETRQDSIPGLEQSGISPERYGQILKAKLTGDDISLTGDEKAGLEIIRDSVAVAEYKFRQNVLGVAARCGLRPKEYDSLSVLYDTSLVFKRRVNSILIEKAISEK